MESNTTGPDSGVRIKTFLRQRFTKKTEFLSNEWEHLNDEHNFLDKCPSRCAVQNSGPSGSPLLSPETLAFSAFMPVYPGALVALVRHQFFDPLQVDLRLVCNAPRFSPLPEDFFVRLSPA